MYALRPIALEVLLLADYARRLKTASYAWQLGRGLSGGSK